MRIELLYVAGCPHHAPTKKCILAVLDELGIDGGVIEREVTDSDEAQALRFPGSPTVRVDGIDVDPNVDANFGLSCRLYDGKPGPTRAMIQRAILSATGHRGIPEATMPAAQRRPGD